MDPVNKTRDLLCNSSIAQQLQTYVLQKPTKGFLGSTIIPTGNVYVAAILPIRLYSYDPKQQLEFYNELWSKLETYYEDKPNIELKGLDFNIKEAIFERMLFNDCYLGGLALFFISLAIFFYSKSFLFTLIIIVGMLLSIGTAFFIYAMVWGITFFPFINLLVLIIAIAVGADDAFLLLSQFKREKRKFEKIVAQTLNFDLSSSSLPRCEQKGSSYELTEAWMCNPLFLETNGVHYALEHALRHATMAMFVTSATTAVAFLANYFSNILVLKCFGIFAGITMSTNYLFVITALPASILMLEGKCSRCEEATSETITFFKFGRLFIDYTKELYCYKLPRVVHRFSIPITLSTLIIGILAVYAILVDPGIRLPENNPLQVLRSSNPFEFFAEHERSLFDFSSKRQVFQIAYVLFGVSPTKDASNFVVDDVGSISLDPNFELKTLRKFQSMEKVFEDFVQLPFLKITTKDTANSWLTNFLFWAQSCNLTEHNCCGLNENTTNYSYGQCFLEYAKKSPTMPMPQDLSPLNKLMDGPIFNKNDGNFLGYYFAAPTNFQYVLIYEDLKPLFKDLNLMKGLAKDEGFSSSLVLSTPYSSQIFDILNTLLNGTMLSVLVSIAVSAVVIVLTTWRPWLTVLAVLCISWAICCITAFVLLLGWTINVFEATVIVLTIGLSFDYTLHIAVAYKSAPDFVVKEKVVYAIETVGAPVFMSAATNFLAGLALVWSETQAFFEIGVFLLTMTVISFIAAIIIFPAMLFIVTLCYKRKI